MFGLATEVPASWVCPGLVALAPGRSIARKLTNLNNRLRRSFEVRLMLCENSSCLLEHDGSFGSGRFCSSACSHSFSSKIKRAETNLKVSIVLRGTKRDSEIPFIVILTRQKLVPKWSRPIAFALMPGLPNGLPANQSLESMLMRRFVDSY